MVVCKPRPMITRIIAAFIFPFLLSGCGGPATAIPLAELDYAEVENQTGWTLRLHGDGSGSLSHVQLPTYHLHYPAMTFDASPARQLTSRCKGKNENPVCITISFYASRTDELTECRCAPGTWPTRIMEQAIAEMQEAVDAGGSERSCRMLRRQWLAAR